MRQLSSSAAVAGFDDNNNFAAIHRKLSQSVTACFACVEVSGTVEKKRRLQWELNLAVKPTNDLRPCQLRYREASQHARWASSY